MRLLLCDDEPDVVEVLGEMLSSQGFEVVSAENGQKGLELVHAQEIDLIVTDLKMPVLDGISFARGVRKTGRFIPIIFLSANSTAEDLKNLIEIGADAFFDKPFSSERIVQAARRSAEKAALHGALLLMSEGSSDLHQKIQKLNF